MKDDTKRSGAIKKKRKKATRTSGGTSPKRKDLFPVVGIGASAGGLEALQAFFKAMPADSGAGFVVVVHLDPSHVSILPELLQRCTSMPVRQAEEGISVKPNSICVIPPNRNLGILHRTVSLMDIPVRHGANLAIDSFFRSLAQDQTSNAIGIVLSGTGTDGTLGLKAIKEQGGLAMVQSEDSAKYAGMPHNAIAMGVADFVLSPEQMPEQLVNCVTHPTGTPTRLVEVKDNNPEALQKIHIVLRARTGHDFSLYKKNTICRRIDRRMNVHQLDNLSDYVRLLQHSEREVEALFQDLLIGVTSFFRDPQAFEALRQILPDLLRRQAEGQAFRVWCPACSSGEEAYTMAILLRECMSEIDRGLTVQIFATDIDERAISVARAGRYPASIAADVPPDLLEKYFLPEGDGHYRISKPIREMVIFAEQDVLKDPPFSRLDLLSCRNLLIYLGPELQQRLLPLFYYSLKPGGLLMLGTSESSGQATDLFEAVDKKWKIYRRSGATAKDRSVALSPGSLRAEIATLVEGPENSDDIVRLMQGLLRQSELPPCVVINAACEVLYVHGYTDPFLKHAEGKVRFKLSDRVHPGLKPALSVAIRESMVHQKEVVRAGVRLQKSGRVVDLTVKPISAPDIQCGLTMVVFREAEHSASPKPNQEKRKQMKEKKGPVAQLEKELQETREGLQVTIEELETSNEELKSTNEELQSTNEELQSTNEELETSKEELQSLNEESIIVNAELQGRIDELAKANDDIKNLFDSTALATIFLDAELCVRRFTTTATDIVPLAEGDTGRPLKHFSTELVGIDLAGRAKEVLDDLVVQEQDVSHTDGRWFAMKIRPYRTLNNVIDGVVFTFIDITDIKDAVKKADLATEVAEAIVDTVREPLLVLDGDLRVISANPAFCSAFLVEREKTEDQLLYELGDGQWNIPELRRMLEEVIPKQGQVLDYEVTHDFPSIGKQTMMLNARLIKETPTHPAMILLALEDVTE